MQSQLLFLFLSLSQIFCGTDEHDSPTPPNPERYIACCGASNPVEYNNQSLGIYVYVPNVFTPNADGVNDYFIPSFDKATTSVTDFAVYSVTKDTVLWSADFVDWSSPAFYGWNGFLSNKTIPYDGLFHYEMLVHSGGNTIRIEGSACRITCGSDAVVFKTKAGCFYPIQAGTNGSLNTNLPNGESVCFE